MAVFKTQVKPIHFDVQFLFRKTMCMLYIGQLTEGSIFGVQFYWKDRCVSLSLSGFENLEMKHGQGWVSI